MLLSTNHFTVRPYRILNVEESKDFIDFVRKAELEVLTGILGYSLWSDVDGGTVTDELTALKDGAEYDYNDITYKYYGLVDLLKPAITSLWIEQNNYILTNVGYVEKAPPEHNTVIDPQAHIATLWNEFSKKVGVCREQKGGTLYGFMKANEENYPDWDFTLPETKNRYGL